MKAAQLQDDEIAGLDLFHIGQQTAPDVAAEPDFFPLRRLLVPRLVFKPCLLIARLEDKSWHEIMEFRDIPVGQLLHDLENPRHA